MVLMFMYDTNDVGPASTRLCADAVAFSIPALLIVSHWIVAWSAAPSATRRSVTTSGSDAVQSNLNPSTNWCRTGSLFGSQLAFFSNSRDSPRTYFLILYGPEDTTLSSYLPGPVSFATGTGTVVSSAAASGKSQ